MKAIKKSLMIAGLASATVAAMAPDAHATRFTETANFWIVNGTPAGGPPLSAIELQGLSGGGGLFTNTFGLNPGGGSVVINTVGANFIRGVDLNPGATAADLLSPVNLGDQRTQDHLLVIFALSGNAVPTGPDSAVANFTTGRAIVISFDTPATLAMPGYEANRPSSWQFDATGANVLGIYDLAPQETLVQGPNGDTIGNPPVNGVDASQTNISAINLINANLSQGILLFDFAGNGDALPLAGNGPFHETVNPIGKPGTEGLVVIAGQSNPNTAVGFNAADEAVLNSIMQTLLTTDFSNNSIPGLTNFNPNQIGDFFNEFDVNVNPTSQSIVPEPATLGLAMAGLAGLALRRRRIA